MDGPGAHHDSHSIKRSESALGGARHDEDHEGEEASGDEGWEEVSRAGAAVEGDAEVE